jgi:hypothetical protein
MGEGGGERVDGVIKLGAKNKVGERRREVVCLPVEHRAEIEGGE